MSKPKLTFPSTSATEGLELFRIRDPMTHPGRDKWLKAMAKGTTRAMVDKFKMGRIQYGSDFGEQTVSFLLDQIEQEAIDQLMYVRELKRRIVMENRNEKQGTLL